MPEDFHTPKLQNALQELGFTFSEQSTAMYFELTQINELSSQDLIIENVKADNYQWLDTIQKAFGGSDKINQQYSDALVAAATQINIEHFIGLQKGQAVAAITITCVNDCARIDNVATHPDYQRLGYASQMVRFCMKLAVSKTSKRVFLEASSDGLGLYKRLGFKEIFKNYIYEWQQL